MNLTSETFINLLELCMRHLLVGNYDACAGIARQVLALAPDEAVFHLVMDACQRTPHRNSTSYTTTSCEEVSAETSHDNFEDTLQKQEGQVTPSSSLYQAILTVAGSPHDLRAHERLIRVLIQLKRPQQAMQAVERCIALAQSDGTWLLNLADFILQLGHHNLAKPLYTASLRKLDLPETERAFRALGLIERQEKNFIASEAWFRRALEIDPANYANQRELVNLSLHQGNVLTAKKLTNEFAAINPKSLSLFILKTCLELQPGYLSEKQIEESRRAFIEGLKVLEANLPGIPDRLVPEFESLLDNFNPFYLPYQGKSTIDDQRTFARIAESMMQRFLPLPPLEARPPVSGRRIRVGIISGFFRDHSNYKIPIKGWLKELDRNSFEIFGYHVSTTVDSQTQEAATYFDHFTQGPHGLNEWVNIIRSNTLDVLIYPEIGMDPTCRKLSCFRLAPVQVNSWGHPVTSGLSTIDYFLSSALMEGPDSDKEYTEKLIRLPKLSINYEPPNRTLLPIARSHKGLRDDAVVYWCCQVVYKHLPHFDWVYAEIASQVPNSQFVFITIQPASEVCLLFRERMLKVFRDKGLVPEQHLVFLEGLTGDEFATVASLCDLCLDSFEWSGCNSSLETLAQGVPIITCPGQFMRGRHTEAILKTIQCEELVTSNPEDFIQLAVSLGNDPSRRASLRAQVKRRIGLAYHDPSCVRELERLLLLWASKGSPNPLISGS